MVNRFKQICSASGEHDFHVSCQSNLIKCDVVQTDVSSRQLRPMKEGRGMAALSRGGSGRNTLQRQLTSHQRKESPTLNLILALTVILFYASCSKLTKIPTMTWHPSRLFFFFTVCIRAGNLTRITGFQTWDVGGSLNSTEFS